MTDQDHETAGPREHGHSGIEKRARSCEGKSGQAPENRASLDAPRLEVEQVGRKRTEVPGTWTVTWSIVNDSLEPLELRASHVPHGKFRGKRADLSRLPPLAPGAQRAIQLPVIFTGPARSRVENAFLILTAAWKKSVWRIFVRMTVESDGTGAPVAKTEWITAHEVGFSRENHEDDR